MFTRFFPPAVATCLLLMVLPSISGVRALAEGRTDPKFVGTAVFLLLVMVLLALLVFFGAQRPGLSLSVLGGSAVTIAATAWLIPQPGQLLLTIAAGLMAALSLWAAATEVDRMRELRGRAPVADPRA
ncbi:MAG: hypothetical protein WAS07_07955 [Micropruina sp.]